MALAAAAAVTGTAAIAAYLDAKFHIGKDVETIRRIKAGERLYKQIVKEDKISLWYAFADAAARYPNATAIWSRQGTYTFAEVHDEAARYAQWLLAEGIRPGELVGMYLINCPEFIIIWLAILSIGCSPAFLNYNLEGKVLLHCLDVCETKLVIVDEDEGCRKRIEGSREAIEASGKKIVYLDDNLKRVISSIKPELPGREYRDGFKGESPFCLIFTSGTTGLPKGCAFTTERVRILLNPDWPSFGQIPGEGGDRWYNCMPLYHGTGAITSMTALLIGVSIAIGRRFSVRNFWKDIHDSQASMFIYVGETARYLLNAPPDPYERDHRVRLMYGNGLRPDVWEKFRQRFNVAEVAEFFNSTEGMFALLAYDRGSGIFSSTVGHQGLLLRYLTHNVYVPVQIDHDTGDIWRDPKTSFAKRAPYNDGGELLVALPNEKAFQGYWRSEEATQKKFVRNVFKKGDIFYRTGDALRRDVDGRWYFMDRLGDTFRWKSENVSTAEVSIVLGNYPGVAEANVYGVLVPNHDGRAGCAALNLSPDVDPAAFDYNAMLKYARERLPKYAVPVFIRQVNASSHIHNHKQNKVPLRKEGVDPTKMGTEDAAGKNDRFLWIPPRSDAYVPFGAADWKALNEGKARL